MELLRHDINFNFMGRNRQIFMMTATALVVLVSIGSLVIRGLDLGLDFTGGVLVELGSEGPADLESIRSTLAAEGYAGATVQNFGTASEVLIRLPPDQLGADAAADAAAQADAARALAGRVVSSLQAVDASLRETRPADFVGPQIGEELVEQGGQAMIYAVLMIFLYIVVRFRWKFAVGATIALAHDIIITFGFLSLTGIDYDQTVLAAMLAVIGYSLNDKVVVFDRIRENFRLIRRGTPEAVINTSINQTLARTIVTGVTTLLVLAALYFIGGSALQGFSITLIVGILVATYSSIYVASAATLWLKISTVDMLPPKREAADDMP
jgi:preprotein translocase subunit SecF